MSDLHGFRPKLSGIDADILIIAGDIAPDMMRGVWSRHLPGVLVDEYMTGQFKNWLQPYIDSGQIRDVVYTWGNHDWTSGYAMTPLGPHFHCIVDDVIDLHGVRIWCSPWSNTFMKWDWMKEPERLAVIYDQIPNDIDILVSHTPPYQYGDPAGLDLKGQMIHAGSVELLRTIERVKPELVVCGHFHSGYGMYSHAGSANTIIVNATCVDEQYRLMRNVTALEVDFHVGV